MIILTYIMKDFTSDGKIKVAIGIDSSGLLCTDHFGESAYYLIYEISLDDRKIKFLEKRENVSKDFMENVHGDPKKFALIINILHDVDVFIGLRYGPNIKLILNKTNKFPFILRGRARKTRSVEDALDEFISHINEINR